MLLSNEVLNTIHVSNMADSAPLIIPVLSPSGNILFASVLHNATIKDVIESLRLPNDTKDEILDDLTDEGWDIQKVRREKSGRVWDEEELESIGTGTL